MSVKPENRPLILHIGGSEDEYSAEAKRPSKDIDYFDQYLRVEAYLRDQIHEYVNQGAAANDQILLTDHGPKHINTVIQRIGDLTLQDGCWAVSPYEAYLLAAAAHFHDMGNMFGRAGHERRASFILFEMDESLIGTDTSEKRLIRDIAQAHGGFTNDKNKDTIGNLQQPEETKRLAAIVRFADELADDRTRTAATVKKMMDENLQLRKESEVFHMYADRLRSVGVNHATRTVSLSFELLLSHFKKKYWKNGVEVYLLDEIYKRTLKTHCEQVYCGKFMLPDVILDRTRVDIEICSSQYENVIGRFAYVLEQSGYPSHIQSIDCEIPQLALLTGSAVASRIERHCIGDTINVVDSLREDIESDA